MHGLQDISAKFLRLSNRLVLWSMVPLMLGISSDLYIVARLIAGRGFASLAAAIAMIAFVGLWFVFPRVASLQRMLAGSKRP